MEAENALETEAFSRLNVKSVTDLADVFQHVPANHKLKDPGDAVIVLGELNVKPLGGGTKDQDDEDIEGTFTIVAICVGEERAPLWRFKKAIRDRLDKWTADREGWRLTFIFADASGFYDDEDDAYVGVFKFTVIARAITA